MNCGLYGFRPTARRMSKSGSKKSSPYTPSNIYAVLGPLASSVEDCISVMEALSDQEITQKMDPTLPFVPWKEEEVNHFENKGKLRVGYIKNLKFFQSSDAAQRGVTMALDKLK